MKKLYIISIICLTLSSCNNLRQVSANYDYKTECAGVEGDGSQTLIAWGNGRNRFDAIEQAKKNAVRDVIFKGISDGKDGCNKRPVLGEVNARQKYEDYFNAFFTDEGKYLNFISLKDERIDLKLIRDRKAGRKSISHSIVVRVDRPGLKQQFIKDKILKN